MDEYCDDAINEIREEYIEEAVEAFRGLYPEWSSRRIKDLSDRISKLDFNDLESVLLSCRERLVQQDSQGTDESPKTRYCYNCGTTWAPGYITCIACGGEDQGKAESRPTVHVEDDTESFMGPWKLLPWPRSGVVGMYGGPGAGKSSLAAMIQPKVWLTKEQIPKPVGELFRRLWGDEFMPQVHVVEDADEVEEALQLHYNGPVVLDSATALNLKDGLRATEMLKDWAQLHNDRALVIMQINKAGDSAGYMEIPHMVDAVVNISPDPWGVRSFRVNKSRWCPLGATYWGFDAQGRIEVPDFPASYSVEGQPGNYWLHPFPIKGSKWEGLLAAMSGNQQLVPRCASAAVRAPYMPHGFVEPMDVHERRRFAEAHGLSWVSPENYQPPPGENS